MGIDIGTTSVKTAVFNETLEEKITLTADYTLDSHGDIVEFDGESYWTIVKGEIEKVKREMGIDALAVDTQCETLILTDADGNPVRPAIVWLDNRAVEEAEMIEKHFGHKKVYEVTGHDLLARAMCHELDHLDGKLYTDRAIEKYLED